jgi:hypothetical protein
MDDEVMDEILVEEGIEELDDQLFDDEVIIDEIDEVPKLDILDISDEVIGYKLLMDDKIWIRENLQINKWLVKSGCMTKL